MVNPQFVKEEVISLIEVKSLLTSMEKRDVELNYRTNKAKEFIDQLEILAAKKAEELRKNLEGLGLTRLKHEHMMKIIDFLPKDIEELKTVLQAYPLSLPKKDQEAIIGAVKDFI
jgi:DNA-directed RNA polymerase subunit F